MKVRWQSVGPLDFHGWLKQHLQTVFTWAPSRKKNSEDADMDIFDSEFKTTVDENWFLGSQTSKKKHASPNGFF